MQITSFSIFTSLIFFNVFILVLATLRKNNKFIYSFSVKPLLFIILLSILRVIFNFEFFSAYSIKSKNILAAFFDFLKLKIVVHNTYFTVLQLLIFLWVSGIVFFILYSVKYYLSMNRYLKLIPKSTDDRNNRILEELMLKNNIIDNVYLVKSPEITEPFIKGLFKSIIYIPDMEYSDEELTHILSHELEHHKGKDSIKKIFFHFIKIIFWWNPFIHILSSDLNQILEVHCDLNVTKGFNEDEKESYLNTIRKVINNSIRTENRQLEFKLASNLYGEGRIYNLKQRFFLVLGYDKYKSHKSNFKGLIYVLSFLMFVLSYSIVFKPIYEAPMGFNYDEVSHLGDFEEEKDFIMKREDGKFEIFIDYKLIKISENIDEQFKHLNIYEMIRSEI